MNPTQQQEPDCDHCGKTKIEQAKGCFVISCLKGRPKEGILISEATAKQLGENPFTKEEVKQEPVGWRMRPNGYTIYSKSEKQDILKASSIPVSESDFEAVYTHPVKESKTIQSLGIVKSNIKKYLCRDEVNSPDRFNWGFKQAKNDCLELIDGETQN